MSNPQVAASIAKIEAALQKMAQDPDVLDAQKTAASFDKMRDDRYSNGQASRSPSDAQKSAEISSDNHIRVSETKANFLSLNRHSLGLNEAEVELAIEAATNPAFQKALHNYKGDSLPNPAEIKAQMQTLGLGASIDKLTKDFDALERAVAEARPNRAITPVVPENAIATSQKSAELLAAKGAAI